MIASSTDELNEAAQAHLRAAQDQLHDEDLSGAEASYGFARDNGALAQAELGLGLVARARRQWQQAIVHFTAALTADPLDVEAKCYCAEATERIGDVAAASRMYDDVLRQDPRHALARHLRAWLWTDAAFRQRVDAEVPPVVADAMGVYANLLEDPSLLSAQGVLALRSVREFCQPSWWTFAGLILPLLAAKARNPHRHPGTILALASLVALVYMSHPDPGLVIFMGSCAFLIGALIWCSLQSSLTTVAIDRGRLVVTSGVLVRTVRCLELFRITGIEFKRGVIHQCTNTGYYVIHTPNEPPLIVPGPGEAKSLITLHHRLLDLVFLLRANGNIKGIIY